MRSDMILILGVTGSGKGRLAFELAKAVGAEIISVDSMKVYRRMDIGTAKPPVQARKEIQYHLIDVVEPSDSFSVGLFLDMAMAGVEQIKNRGKPVIAVGGTALYIKALLYGIFDGPGGDEQIRRQLQDRAEAEGLEQLYRQLQSIDPTAAENIHPNDAKRLIRALEVFQITGKPISSLQKQWHPNQTAHDWTVIGLRRQKADASGRINSRVKTMMETGLVEEVKSLLAEDKPLGKQARCAIGYAEIIEHLQVGLSLQEVVEQVKKNTRRLAKNQRTWFKTFSGVNWLDIQPEETTQVTLERAEALLANIRDSKPPQ